jgi:1-deoxy-D-xylulose-5-phosphate reductoisomerase
MKNIIVLGATGSIGTQTMDILRSQKKEFNLLGISIYSSYEKAIDIINEFKVKYICIMEEKAKDKIVEYKKNNGLSDLEIFFGIEGLETIASIEECDLVLNSVVGMVGLRPTIAALKKGKDIALANKETLVTGGEIVMKLAKKNGCNIFPVDSEHSAIFQALRGNKIEQVNKIILTASGGPFREMSADEIKKVSVKQALKHPNWSMGKKVTIDSSTLMNKGLEVIEARWLFDVDYENIEVVVHPESIVHSMVEYIDGSIIAQLSTPDMRLPIQYALNYPDRKQKAINRLNLINIKNLSFYSPDYTKFPCLSLAFKAGKVGKGMPCILNASNEIAVQLFLDEKIKFYQIYDIVEECMDVFEHNIEMTLENILSLDQEVKKYVLKKYN